MACHFQELAIHFPRAIFKNLQYTFQEQSEIIKVQINVELRRKKNKETAIFDTRSAALHCETESLRRFDIIKVL